MIHASDSETIDFDFYDSKSYKLIQEMNLQRYHYNVATFAQTLRTEAEDDFKS